MANELKLDFKKRGGLIPVIVQDEQDGQVLMLGYTNEEAFNKSMTTRIATFWSTSRKELWQKGATSGDTLEIKQINIDCDQDALLYIVKPVGGGTCHTKRIDGSTRKSCFYRILDLEEEKLIIMPGEE